LFILKPHSGVPIFRQLGEQIRRMVTSGQLAAGAELPSIRELAVRYAINPMTVSKIYSILEAEGVLERNRGKPMTVAAGQSPKEPVGSRLRQLEPHLENLALAAKQLNLGERDVTRALRKKLEK
jgi:GntR family transcriptional regulator